MNTYKRNFFGLFFLSYFAVYAVSPIIYTLSPGSTSEFIGKKAMVPSFADGFQVFFLETVCGKFIPGEEEPSGSAAVKFLIRKKTGGPAGKPPRECALGRYLFRGRSTSFVTRASGWSNQRQRDHRAWRRPSPPLSVPFTACCAAAFCLNSFFFR